MDTPRTNGDELRGISSGLIWGITFVVVAICAFGFEPVETLRHIIESRGVGADEATLLGFVAGLTLPLTLAIGIIAFLVLSQAPGTTDQLKLITISAVLLFGAAFIARKAQLGLPLDDLVASGSPPQVLVRTLFMYLSSYGFPLMLSSVTIGAACGIQAERLHHSVNSSSMAKHH